MNVLKKRRAGSGSVRLPQLPSMQRIERREVERSSKAGQITRLGAFCIISIRAGVDVFDQYGTGCRAVGLPQLGAVSDVGRPEIGGRADDFEELGL
jgi:hypothetical protein